MYFILMILVCQQGECKLGRIQQPGSKSLFGDKIKKEINCKMDWFRKTSEARYVVIMITVVLLHVHVQPSV